MRTRLENLSDVIDMGAVEHLPRLDDPPRLAMGQIDERIAAGAIDACKAQDVRFRSRAPGPPPSSGFRPRAAPVRAPCAVRVALVSSTQPPPWSPYTPMVE